MNCYVLYSPSLNIFYTGITTVDVDDRISKHNLSVYGQKYTSRTKDWELFLSISCECSTQMYQIERHIKRMKSSIYIRNLKRYPEMIEKLKTKYSCNRLGR